MKLSRRITYILLPVIFAIFSVAGMYAYSNQKNLIISTVADKLKYTGQHTISDIHKNVEELLSLTEVFLNSAELTRYLNRDVSDGSAMISENHLIRYLGRFHLSYGQFRKVSLLDESNRFIFHFDANDPFSSPELDNDLMEHQSVITKQLKAAGSTYLDTTSYLIRKGEGNTLKLIVFRTFSPQHLIADNTFSGSMKFATAITETTLDVVARYQDPMRISFHEGIHITIDPVSRVMVLPNTLQLNEVREKESVLTVRSKSELAMLEISLPASYLKDLLRPYWNNIISLIFSVSILTFLILKFLIQKQIISPVVRLTKQVANARTGDDSQLKKIDRQDEIALLNNNYVLLFDELNKLAKVDSLTGLSNRVLFSSALKRTVSRSIRHELQCALLYIDLDNFKYVNDHYGHHVGDDLLQAFAQSLIDIFAQIHHLGLVDSDYEIARLAGDEFAVLISNVPNSDAVAMVARKTTDLCSHGFKVKDQYFDINVSIGIAMCPSDSMLPDELLKHADSAMYQVKNSGKNGYQFYSKALENQINQHARIEEEIKKALEGDNFYLVWMPIYDCRSGKITGAEALLRCDSVCLKAAGPSEFIPIAETTGLIKAIDYWVIESAIIKLKELIDNYEFSGVLSVNFSAWQLKNQHFAYHVALLIDNYQVPAEQIELEITETCLIADDILANTILKELKAVGVRLSLDDFGTGYTAFNQLAEYTVDILKVDRSFISSIFETKNVSSKPLIDIIVELASLYSLDVVAEGIETKEQLEYVRKLGCDRAQGFYLSKPISWEAFTLLIENDLESAKFRLESYDNDHQLEFKCVTGSVKVIISTEVVTLLYKGIIDYELLDFVMQSLSPFMDRLSERKWGIITVADDEYELSAETRDKLAELVQYCYDHGCVDGAYVMTKPKIIEQIESFRRSLNLSGDFNDKNFASQAKAAEYIKQAIKNS
ncbi:bifunctional diguanylate cyclase/phosphodiesterase [Vibrio sp. RC27]